MNVRSCFNWETQNGSCPGYSSVFVSMVMRPSGKHRAQMASGITRRLQMNPLCTCRPPPPRRLLSTGLVKQTELFKKAEQVPIILRSDPYGLLLAVCTTAHWEFYIKILEQVTIPPT